MIPARVGFYEVLHKVGEGGMGLVYLARDRRADQRVALKVLAPHHAHNLALRARFLREGQLGQLVRHPNVVAVHELGEAHLRGPERTLYLAMEMVSGRELGHRLAFESLDQKTLVDLGRQIAEGLAAAHGAGIVHRDLKPGNVLVSSDGIAKILDFGLACRLDDRRLGDETGGPLTSTGAFVGTLGYASPEQLSGAPADARSDLFSLGVILYQAATGRLPFPAQSRGEAIAGFGRELVLPRVRAPGIAPRFEEAILRLLPIRPADRVPSAAEAAVLLQEVAAASEEDALSRPLAGDDTKGESASEPATSLGTRLARLRRGWRRR